MIDMIDPSSAIVVSAGILDGISGLTSNMKGTIVAVVSLLVILAPIITYARSNGKVGATIGSFVIAAGVWWLVTGGLFNLSDSIGTDLKDNLGHHQVTEHNDPLNEFQV